MADEPTTPDIEVEIEPGDEKTKPRLTDSQLEEHEKLPDDEIGKYATEAQRRIRGLRVANQEWRRRSIQSSQDVATATSLAEQLYRENQELKSSMGRSETALIDQAHARAEAQLDQAKTRLMAAMAAQDAAGQATAYEDIAKAVAELDRLGLLKQPKGEGRTAPPAAAPPPPPRPVPESERLRSWRSQNTWFGQAGEEDLTGFAYGIHQKLTAQGVTELTNPDLYYSTIDARMREKFPERFGKPAARPAPVAGAPRVNGEAAAAHSTDSGKVKLTESEVRLAKSLGVDLKEYAKQKLDYASRLKEREGKVTVQ
ncbi:MAG TPA: hypothetical protein VH157_06990 [Bryobacteraceae bacterium]|jgi:hypothetical protein|nr:hypothetical protein [Bryobacteraceae bacterium]